ncbi:MAG TPA: RagB/SusD family nutrient uptake outer membrane protein, partial [Longimicrobiales bacterium]|nr:RagB/SusD family nutrient uptake outer membrane protein [Longimicrobiales bacterium]
TLTTKTFNQAAGLMYTWWGRIDQSDEPGFVRDPWTNQPDPRMPVYFDGEIATDNETPHYSQWKYHDVADDIPMVHSDHMRLIEAEVLMRQGDFDGATAILNNLRGAVGLDPFDVPADEDTMLAYLLSERQAELFMEGMRAVDLNRFGLMEEVFAAMNDPERPAHGRPTKWPMSDNEASLNPQIVDDRAVRCLPTTQ